MKSPPGGRDHEHVFPSSGSTAALRSLNSPRGHALFQIGTPIQASESVFTRPSGTPNEPAPEQPAVTLSPLVTAKAALCNAVLERDMPRECPPDVTKRLRPPVAAAGMKNEARS